MMKLTWIYQYISLNQEVLKILQILKKCPKTCIIPILDLEDSLQIPLDPEKTAILKSRAREILKSVLSLATEQDLQVRISLRINAFNTEEFRHDMAMLHEINPLITWGSLFLPKVHSADVLSAYLHALEEIRYDELVVMAESKAFFDHYPEIIRLCQPYQ
jgi:citrate lyase beta subunit